MTFAVAVDFGTSSTCVAVAVDDEAPRVVVIDGSPLMPSAVYADGHTLFVGAEAQRQAALDPARYEPTPKRRIDEDSLLLGDTVVPVQRAIAAVLARAVREARNTVGGRAVDVLVLTHPADWGAVRLALLRSAAHGLAAVIHTVAEPVAAALQYGAGAGGGGFIAVLDVGAGTTDVSVLQREGGEFRVLATRGDPSFGGADVDEALLNEVGGRLTVEQRPEWEAVVDGRHLQQRRRLRVLREDVRGAKESLSRHAYADVPLPGSLPDGHVTRTDLEGLIRPRLASVVELLATALREAGALDDGGTCRAVVFLVGGSSRIPLVASTVHQRLGVLPISTEQPETVVARGALQAKRRAAPAPVTTAAGPPPATAARPPVTTAAGPLAIKEPVSVGRMAGFRRHRWIAPALAVLVAVAGAGLWWAYRPSAPPGREVAALRAGFTVPAGWQEARRAEYGGHAQVELTPDGTPSGDRALFLVQTALDPALTQADVARALRTQLDVEQAAGKRYEAFDGAADFAGRPVVRYREPTATGAVVDWFVVVQEHTQISVGCQHGAGDAGAMAAPCDQAVRTARTLGA